MTYIKIFIKNSVSVFSEASRGGYKDSRPEHQALKESLFGSKQTIPSDKKSISEDGKRVYSDIRKALNTHSK